MSDHGGNGSASGHIRRSRLSDYAEMTGPDPQADDSPHTEKSQPPPSPAEPDSLPTSTAAASRAGQAGDTARGRREFAVLLGEFRRTAVLVPLGGDDVPLAGDFGGIRWIYAFSSEAALARFAIARGEGGREWPYQRVLGARLLDAAVPAVGVACGVALDVGSEGEGVLFPPVAGIVPDAAAVDAGLRDGEVAR